MGAIIKRTAGIKKNKYNEFLFISILNICSYFALSRQIVV